MISAVKSIASVIFGVLNYKFNAGDVTFSLWSIIMTFLVCGIAGMLIYYFIAGIAKGDD